MVDVGVEEWKVRQCRKTAVQTRVVTVSIPCTVGLSCINSASVFSLYTSYNSVNQDGRFPNRAHQP